MADAVFVGGSIAPRGGHNILEPGAAGAAIVTGMHMQNFESIARDFAAAHAFVQVEKKPDLVRAVRDLLRDRDAARQMGLRARRLVEKNRGVARMVAMRMEDLYYSASLRKPLGGPARLVLTPLAWLWTWGGKIKRERSEQHAALAPPLPVPVISIGGITLGGAGKTPFVNYLAACLKKRGHSPAILTRGYRRRYPAEHLIFAPGAEVSPFFTGDEAQILLRAAAAPVGIGAKRYPTARILLRQFPETDVILLDVGFQHAGIMRDLDVVLIDGLDPFGKDAVFPLGRLREPLGALKRANIFVVTRARSDGHYAAIARRLRQYNRAAPIFRANLKVRGWRDYTTGAAIHELNGNRVAAFCGLGNPQSFWNTLETLGVKVVFRWTFGDHHPYKPMELARISHQARLHGAELLVTTEKDRINCPPHLEKIISPLTLAWLEVEMEVETEAEFLSELSRGLS
jgi:tetraacyldisaccharide 4'-kinase